MTYRFEANERKNSADFNESLMQMRRITNNMFNRAIGNQRQAPNTVDTIEEALNAQPEI